MQTVKQVTSKLKTKCCVDYYILLTLPLDRPMHLFTFGNGRFLEVRRPTMDHVVRSPTYSSNTCDNVTSFRP